MDYKLAKEIYTSAWCVDPITLAELSNTLKFYQNKGEFKENKPKGNLFGIIAENNVFTPSSIDRLENRGIDIPKGSIAQYDFDSAITKNGGASHYGTKEISSQFQKMEDNPNIIGHIFKVESGGGSVNAIRYINNVANSEVRKKPLVTFFEDVNGSAAYVISSNSDWIIANDKHALVGSLGTMMEMSGYKNGEKDADGKMHIRVYSDFSEEKNAEFENAINNADFKLIKENLLNPSALELIEHVSKHRPNLTAKQKRAAIFRAEEVVGTLIDEIGDFSLAINKVKELAANTTNNTEKVESKTPSGENNNQNNHKMTKEEFKAQNPTAYEEIMQEGVLKERDRVEAWAVYNEVNPEKVKAGIESGELLSGKAMAEFNLEISKGQKLEVIEEDSQEEVITQAAEKTEEEIQAEANKSAMDELFKEDK